MSAERGTAARAPQSSREDSSAQSMAGVLLDGVSLKQIFRGVWLFVLMLVVALVIVLEWPGLSLWLPSFMK